jgi:hypothetical protein
MMLLDHRHWTPFENQLTHQEPLPLLTVRILLLEDNSLLGIRELLLHFVVMMLSGVHRCSPSLL